MRRWHIVNTQTRSNAARAVMEIMGENDMDVVIEEHQDDQSAAQSGYFHAALLPILAKHFGVSPNAMKMDLKRETWGSEWVTVRGYEFEIVKSSAKGSAKKEDYSELIETALRIGAEHGCVLPNPYYRD